MLSAIRPQEKLIRRLDQPHGSLNADCARFRRTGLITGPDQNRLDVMCAPLNWLREMCQFHNWLRIRDTGIAIGELEKIYRENGMVITGQGVLNAYQESGRLSGAKSYSPYLVEGKKADRISIQSGRSRSASHTVMSACVDTYKGRCHQSEWQSPPHPVERHES